MKLFSEIGDIWMMDRDAARVAYEIFEGRGRQHGYDWEDWFKAEQVLRERARSR